MTVPLSAPPTHAALFRALGNPNLTLDASTLAVAIGLEITGLDGMPIGEAPNLPSALLRLIQLQQGLQSEEAARLAAAIQERLGGIHPDAYERVAHLAAGELAMGPHILFGEPGAVTSALRARLQRHFDPHALTVDERRLLAQGRTVFRVNEGGTQKTVLRLEGGQVTAQVVPLKRAPKPERERAIDKILSEGPRQVIPVRHLSSGDVHPADRLLHAHPEVIRFYDFEWQTNFYIDTKAALMDKPKGIVLLHSGGGAEYSNGGCFSDILRLLAKEGYIGIAFDTPFHNYGSQAVFGKAWFSYLNRLVQFLSERYRGVPIVGSGRSTGAPVWMKYRRLFPGTIAGVYAMSGYLRSWIPYNVAWFDWAQTAGQLRINRLGTAWVEGVEADNDWLDNPTDEPAGLPPVLFAAGEKDFGGEGEYPPGVMGEWERIARATGQEFYIAPGTGHNVLSTHAPGFKDHWRVFIQFLDRVTAR